MNFRALTDRENRTLTKKIHVTPECGEPDNLSECLCICKANYVLGEACSAGPADAGGDG